MEAAMGPHWYFQASGGTGPFRVTGWQRGVSVTMVANRDYWGGSPRLDGLDFRVLPGFASALRLYEAGELQYLTVPEDAFAAVMGNARHRDEIVTAPRAQTRHIGLNAGRYPPLADRRVRQALSLVIDRAAVVRGLFGGAAIDLPGAATPGVVSFADGVLPPLRHDPEEARRLLAEAGYPDGRGLPPVELSGLDAARDELAYYADRFRRVLGIPVTVRTYERATYINAINAGSLALFQSGWTADYPDAMTYFMPLWHGASPYNRSRWRNADMDRLVDAARCEADEGRRFALYRDAERLLADDWAAVTLPVLLQVALRKPGVQNIGPTPFGNSGFLAATVP
jgi:ABC-type transport system substrate-binding protein